MEKSDFLYFNVEAPKGINLIMFSDGSMVFSAEMKFKKKKSSEFFL